MLLDIDFHETLGEFETRLLEAAAEADPAFNGPTYIFNKPLATARAVTFPGLDRIHEAEIRAAGLWSGRGPCVVLDLDRCYRESFTQGVALGLPERQADRHARITLAGAVVHELAHHLPPRNPEGEKDFFGAGVDVARQVFHDRIENAPATVNPLTPLAPWAPGHDARFIRACVHLTHRMRRSLPDLTYSDTFNSDMYGLSPAKHYAATLAGELLDSKGPIRNIVASAPPAAFRELWRFDVFKWFREVPNKTDEAMAAAQAALALV